MEKIYHPHFDIMKGIAITLMVIGHIILFTFDSEPTVTVRFLYANMPVFFYISGYLAYKRIESYTSLKRRLVNRGMVLLIPYVVFLTLYNEYTGNDNLLGSIAEGGGRYWFLYDLFIIAIFFLIYEYIIRNIKSDWIYIALWVVPYLIMVYIKLSINALQSGGYMI